MSTQHDSEQQQDDTSDSDMTRREYLGATGLTVLSLSIGDDEDDSSFYDDWFGDEEQDAGLRLLDDGETIIEDATVDTEVSFEDGLTLEELDSGAFALKVAGVGDGIGAFVDDDDDGVAELQKDHADFGGGDARNIGTADAQAVNAEQLLTPDRAPNALVRYESGEAIAIGDNAEISRGSYKQVVEDVVAQVGDYSHIALKGNFIGVTDYPIIDSDYVTIDATGARIAASTDSPPSHLIQLGSRHTYNQRVSLIGGRWACNGVADSGPHIINGASHRVDGSFIDEATKAGITLHATGPGINLHHFRIYDIRANDCPWTVYGDNDGSKLLADGTIRDTYNSVAGAGGVYLEDPRKVFVDHSWSANSDTTLTAGVHIKGTNQGATGNIIDRPHCENRVPDPAYACIIEADGGFCQMNEIRSPFSATASNPMRLCHLKSDGSQHVGTSIRDAGSTLQSTDTDAIVIDNTNVKNTQIVAPTTTGGKLADCVLDGGDHTMINGYDEETSPLEVDYEIGNIVNDSGTFKIVRKDGTFTTI
jgi:hypothetical protein